MSTLPWRKWATTNRAPARPSAQAIVWPMLGALLGLGLLGALTQTVGRPLLMAPFGATVVLAFALSESPLAQPRNIVGGHVISALVGFVVLGVLGTDTAALAVGGALALGAMLATRTLHPPSGATALVVILQRPSAVFLLTPVLLGALGIVVVALIVNNLPAEKRYPAYWW